MEHRVVFGNSAGRQDDEISTRVRSIKPKYGCDTHTLPDVAEKPPEIDQWKLRVIFIAESCIAKQCANHQFNMCKLDHAEKAAPAADEVRRLPHTLMRSPSLRTSRGASARISRYTGE